MSKVIFPIVSVIKCEIIASVMGAKGENHSFVTHLSFPAQSEYTCDMLVEILIFHNREE